MRSVKEALGENRRLTRLAFKYGDWLYCGNKIKYPAPILFQDCLVAAQRAVENWLGN